MQPTKVLILFISFALSIVLLIYGLDISLVYKFVDDERDPFADALQIPTNVKVYDPIALDFYDPKGTRLSVSTNPESDFQLYNGFQPGLFEYDIWLGNVGKGTIYLKAFEVTKNTRLSESRLEKQSSMDIENYTSESKKFSTSNTFTIYEGDWGKPYAARFEVWFRADNGMERKLSEKIYQIEGWQR